ncbi:Hypothetical protein, putative [Bodo saltans]|uniref:Uncharacterized protein n=1 Tax=Bodo saltans TaxID=75058 RepID=A0A0S4INV3_BODSA|nr:Hypothetical protein, putative [Bodo saltans]|eukprot:CUF74327.1 Hypothetical protein, putative [Bodo saltans]
MGVEIHYSNESSDLNNQCEALNTPPRLSPRSSFTVKWEGDAYQHNPYVAAGTQEAARHLGLRNFQCVETFNCGGRTHLHIQFSDGEHASFTFSGRNETTGVLKLVGRVPLSEERIVTHECATTPGKWRNTAIRVLLQDILETGALRVACVKVSSSSVECLLSAEERPMFLDGKRTPILRLGAKNI